jgi:hypothetical protein
LRATKYTGADTEGAGTLLLNKLSVSSIVLGLTGASLDFYSGFIFLQMSNVTSSSMGITTMHYNNSVLTWGIAFAVLGVALVATAVTNIFSSMRRMPFFGKLMIIFGVVMVFLSLLMYSGVTPLMRESSLLISSTGMLIVGALMGVNGFLMTKNRTGSAKMLKDGMPSQNTAPSTTEQLHQDERWKKANPCHRPGENWTRVARPGYS